MCFMAGFYARKLGNFPATLENAPGNKGADQAVENDAGGRCDQPDDDREQLYAFALIALWPERVYGEKRRMKEITRINHVGIRVRDLEVTRAFYEKLGFEFLEGPIGPEPVAVMEHPSGVNINFILNTSEDAASENLLMDVSTKHTGYTHIALEITDRLAVERQLSELGMPITETVEMPNGAVFFFIRDPDGNVIEFHKPA